MVKQLVMQRRRQFVHVPAVRLQLAACCFRLLAVGVFGESRALVIVGVDHHHRHYHGHRDVHDLVHRVGDVHH